MKRGIKYFALIFVAGHLCLHASAQAVDLSSYFNLNTGRILAYDRYDFVGGSWTFGSSSATVVVDLGLAKGNVRVQLPAGTLDNMELWELQADGHHWFGEYDFATQGLSSAEPPPGPIDGTMNVGQTRTFDFQQFEDGVLDGPVRVDETLLAANFPYQTPAGNFPDCVLIMLEIYPGAVLDETSYWIWANGVGPVLELITAADGTPIEFRILTAIPPPSP